jgi:uncharacterized protein
MKINEQTIKPGETKEVVISSYNMPSRTIVDIPALVIRSKNDGPKVLFQAGVHGDETNGIEILRQLYKVLNKNTLLCGSVIIIPIVNIFSFMNGHRDLPDEKDLNRCFPGSRTGSLGSRIAHDLMKEIIPNIDFGIDFHTGGAKINNYPQLRCVFENPQNIDLSKRFGAPFIINSPYREKSLRKEAEKRGKSILVFEGGESLRFNKVAVNEGLQGCIRLLNSFNMLQLPAETTKTIVLNSSTWIRAKKSGLFRTNKKFGSFVEKDEEIGYIANPFSINETKLYSPTNGFLIGINNQPVINEGDALIHIGVE